MSKLIQNETEIIWSNNVNGSVRLQITVRANLNGKPFVFYFLNIFKK